MQAIDRRLVARVTLATLLIFGVAGCSSVNVKNQFDPDTDFTKYRRYAWVPNDELPPPEPTRPPLAAFQRALAAALAGGATSLAAVEAKPARTTTKLNVVNHLATLRRHRAVL